MAQIVSKAFGAVAGGSCAGGGEGRRQGAAFGSVSWQFEGEGNDGSYPPLKRLFGIPFIFMFLRSPPTLSSHCAKTLTPKRKEAANNSSFRLQTW